MHLAQTQKQPQTSDTVHHLATPVTGEEVPAEAVPLHRGAGRVLQLPQPDGDPGQNLVSEPEGQSQETAGGRAGEIQAGVQTSSTGCLCAALPAGGPHGLPIALRERELSPEACSARTGTFRWTSGLWNVLFVISRFFLLFFYCWQRLFYIYNRINNVPLYQL